MRPIDADHLKETLDSLVCESDNKVIERNTNQVLHDLMPQVIADEPAVEAEPVKHGRWIFSDDKNWLTCPFCGADVDVSCGILVYVDNDDVSHINFCPICGARLIGGMVI